jgi:RimJ/RimL family protein N-acetyltransferase
MNNKRIIYQISPQQVTTEFRSLFDPGDPASLRCFAVLDGEACGGIYTDCPRHPSWGVVQESAFGSLYLGGSQHYPSLRRLLLRIRRDGDVLVGMWPNDLRWQLMPRSPDFTGSTLDFSNRKPPRNLGRAIRLPQGYELRPLDLALFERCAEKHLYASMYGSAHQALKKGYGLCLTHHQEVLCEAFAGPAAGGTIEIGAATHADHRRKGYATLTCHHLITQVEQNGYRTYWNCSSDNHASIALARRLGYQTEREYRLLAWLKKDNELIL